MEYSINHVHIRAVDPRASASWYEKVFNAKVISEREVMPGTITIGMQVGGPVRPYKPVPLFPMALTSTI